MISIGFKKHRPFTFNYGSQKNSQVFDQLTSKPYENYNL
jgi:hypothetical protein